MYLFDCEDFYSLPIQINAKKSLEEISGGLNNSDWNKMLTCEHFWNNMDPTDKGSAKDTALTIETTLSDLSKDNLEFFSERRLLVLKNRLVLCRLIEGGEAAIEQALNSLIDINMKDAENVVSQQNLAVIALTMGRVQEALYLINRAFTTDSVDYKVKVDQ